MRRSAALRLAVARPEARGDEVRGAGGDCHRGFAASARETTPRHRELETAAVDLDTARCLQTGRVTRVEAQQDSGQEPVQRRFRTIVDRVEPVEPKPRDALQDRQHPLPAHVAECVHGAPDGRRQVGAIDEPGVLQFLEPLGQKIGCDAGQLVAKIPVAARTADQLAQDQQRPPLAQHVEPACDRAVLVVVPAEWHHANVAVLDIFFNLLLDLFVLWL